MIEWIIGWPTWVKILLSVIVSCSCLSSALYRIVNKNDLDSAAFQIIGFIVIMTGFINSLIQVNFRIF